MSKGGRIKMEHLNGENELFARQREELIEQLALARMNYERSTIVMACLVQRLGVELPDGRGTRVFVTDEEMERIDGELVVHRSESALSIVLTLVPKTVEEEKTAEEADSDAVGQTQGEHGRPTAEDSNEDALEVQNSVEAP